MDGTTRGVALLGLAVALPFFIGWLITGSHDALMATYMFAWLCLFAPIVWKTDLLSDGSLRHYAGYRPFVKISETSPGEAEEVLIQARMIKKSSMLYELGVRKAGGITRLHQYSETDDDRALAEAQHLADSIGAPFAIDPESKRMLYERKASRPRRIAGYRIGLLLGTLLLVIGVVLHLMGGTNGAMPMPTLLLYVGGVGLVMIGLSGWMSLRPKR